MPCCLLISQLTQHASRACRLIVPLRRCTPLYYPNCGSPQRKPVELNLLSLSPSPSPSLSLSLPLCLSVWVTLPSCCFHSHSPVPFLPLALLGFLLSLSPYFHLFAVFASKLTYQIDGCGDEQTDTGQVVGRVKNTLGLNINQAASSHFTNSNPNLCWLVLDAVAVTQSRQMPFTAYNFNDSCKLLLI